MITKLGFKNYKAFKDGEIEIKPLTFLVGANSVGKSSLIQLLLMLQQTCVEASPNDKSAFKLNGKKVGLGENINILKDKDKDNVISLSFGLDEKNARDLISKVSLAFYGTLERIFIYSYSESELFDLKKDWKNDKDIFLTLLSRARIHNQVLLNRLFNLKAFNDSYDDIITTYDFVKQVRKKMKCFKKCELSLDFKYIGNTTNKSSALGVSGLALMVNNETVVHLSLSGNKNNRRYYLTSSLYCDNQNFCNSDYCRQLNDILPQNETNLFCLFDNISLEYNMFQFKLNYKFSFFLWLLLSFLNQAIENLASCFKEQSINYVSPLRAYPKRYYFLDKTHVSSSLDTLDGDSITELLKEKPDLRHHVNEWLERFNLQIDVKAIEEIIHKLKVNQNGLEVDITDVGFGISQVLPVIVQGFFAKKNSITVIEQPEVHLHPKMQADLGDLFIDIVLPKNNMGKRKRTKSLLIETHSEYLLKRIRRRIAKREIDALDVAIYIVESDKEQHRSVIRRLDIDSTGTFEWPEEFYGGELLLDTIEYLKAQTRSE